jgi:non-specific serine/threonine protein kinase
MSAPKPVSDTRTGVRMFGRLQLLRLLGKSDRTMAWHAVEPDGAERMLVLPRAQPRDGARLERWLTTVRRGGRLQHPMLAGVLEIGEQDGWPFVVHDLRGRATWTERLPNDGLPAVEAATVALEVLRALAYAHEAGVAHHDLQPWMVLLDDQGQATLAGLAAGWPGESEGEDGRDPDAIDGAFLRAQRRAAERDVLAFGLLLHGVLAGAPALDEPDIGRLIERLPPHGREGVRLPWTGPHPIPDPLRAIVNRATARQPRQRYLSARTLIVALEGWLQSEAGTGASLWPLLSDRLRAAGTLPSAPGAAARVARLALMERERTNELADVVLEDLALSFELLRAVNTAQVRGAQVSGSGPVLTVRRAIALLGLEGVRRSALALRPWPGPLDEAAAAQLERLIERAKRAGRVALALRPGAYDAEVVYLVTLLHSLGHLVVQYLFADEAQQIRRLMEPAPSASERGPAEPGLTEESAAYAVLGTDIGSIGLAVARSWGVDESVLALIRRLPLATPVRAVDTEDDMLRVLASCAHEALEALEAAARSAPRELAALQRVVQRYARALDLTLRDLQAALQDAPSGPISAGGASVFAALDAMPERPAATPAVARPPA